MQGTERIDTVFAENSAKSDCEKLVDKGIRGRYERRSRTITEEPYVEHLFDIIVDYAHIDEVNCAKRILCVH